MKVLSLFDGMSCGYIALKNLGIEVERYVAYENDKYAIKTSKHNFPDIEHCGDVFDGDFTQYADFDFLMGGSPCTYWSIAQKNNRETTASGLGWELFQQYVRALHESKPKYFLYENNKSMSKAIRASIDEAFGFEAICINSALVSAQNRNRLYWVGKRNDGGTYSKVDIKQPEDRGILLKDVLDIAIAWQDKSYTYTTRCQGAVIGNTLERHQHTMVAEPVNFTVDGKSQCLRSTYYKDGARNIIGNDVDKKTGVGLSVLQNKADNKIYEVKNGMITYNGKQHPIKLLDGYYIIRKLTVKECMRLQTVPEWFEFPVSKTQAYKQLGNGWTCEVISHLIKSALEEQ